MSTQDAVGAFISEKMLEKLLKRQNNKCQGCGTSVTKSGNTKAVLDYNENGEVRGALCVPCIGVLSLVKEKGTLRRLMAYLSHDVKKVNVYLVGALKNEAIPYLALTLEKEGYSVFAEWHNPGPEADMHWQEHEKLKGSSYKEALDGSHVENVFYYDKSYIDLADIVVLVMPAGKSGHLELGYATGIGKHTFILLDEEPERYDIMPRFAKAVCNNVSELIEEMGKCEIPGALPLKFRAESAEEEKG